MFPDDFEPDETIRGLAEAATPEALVRLPDAIQEAGHEGLGGELAEWGLGQSLAAAYIRWWVRRPVLYDRDDEPYGLEESAPHI